MRLLVLDHFFAHDIDALRRALGPGDELRTLPYPELRDAALRVFPPAVASGLEAFAEDRHASHREAYARTLRGILEREFSAWPFDAFVVPSDLFFYVRAAPEACHALGVPFLVAQKETTISPNTMREHAARIRRYAPPAADHMTVCSEHHKAFWLEVGADPASITVTGQPRFDLLAEGARTPDPRRERPVVLFLSYLTDAYHPDGGAGRPAWSLMHRQTTEGLAELARTGWTVLVKPHPQQATAGMREELAASAGRLLDRRVLLVDGDADVRPMLAGADVVVGFQSTAMIEAMAAGRPVLYTGWDPGLAGLEDELLPFARWGDVLDVVTDPAALADTVRARRGWRPDAETTERRRAIFEAYLGPVDGAAARRTLEVIAERVRAAKADRTPEVEAHRRAVAARRDLDLRRRGRALRRAAGLAVHRARVAPSRRRARAALR